jgi:hypothetical protein
VSRTLDLRRPLSPKLPIQATVTRRKRGFDLKVRFPKFSKPLVFGLVAIILLTIVLPILQAGLVAQRYVLKSETSKLLDNPSPKMATHISHDDEAKAFYFNKAGIKDTSPSEPSQSVGTSNASELYSAKLSEDGTKGVTIYDNVNNVSFEAIPQFATLAAKQDVNRIIYPAGATPAQVIYTLKANGVKEDIILPHATADNMSFAYKLNLGDTLEARLLESGAVGIFSADPTLFGNISFGSDTDREKVEAARKNSKKTNLVFSIPAPIIKESQLSSRASVEGSNETPERSHQQGRDDSKPQAKFELKNNVLTLAATGLKNASYPLSIDPTIIVTSSSDFRKAGNNEGNIDFDGTNNTIKRGGLTGGTVGTFSNAGSFNDARFGLEAVASNGFMYTLGGHTTGNITLVEVTKLNEDGTLSSPNLPGCSTTWCATTQFPGARSEFGATAYNGYIYVMGGAYVAANEDIMYAKVNADGSLSTWLSGAGFTNRRSADLHAYNGRMYMLGGVEYTETCDIFGCTVVSDALSTVQYADIRADGSIGSWTTNATSLPQDCFGYASAIYNGFIYLAGGHGGCSPTASRYARISSVDGTVGSWTTGPTLPNTRIASAGFAANGYFYVAVGCSNTSCDTSISAHYADTLLLPIFADGSMGASWQSNANTLATGRARVAGLAANGSIYLLGGCGVNPCVDTRTAEVQRAQINTTGVAGNWTTQTNTYATARQHPATIAYNGYLYVAGGSTSADDAAASLADVQFAPINSNGSIGSWTATTSFTNKRIYHDLVAYNGYLYIVGGQTHNGLASVYLNEVRFAQVNADGTLGSWTATNSFTTARGEHATVAYNGYLYVIGGRTGNAVGDVLNDVQKAQIGPGGGLSSGFSTTGLAQLPGNKLRFGATVLNNRMYVVAGCTSINAGSATCASATGNVLYTDSINSTNGNFTSWTTITNALGHISYDYGSVVADKDKLYISGGQGANAYAGIEFGSFDLTTGGLISWTQSTTISSRADWETTFYNGNFYAVGGSVSRTIDYVPVNNGGSGSLASSSSGTSLLSNTTRRNHRTLVYNGHIYAIGGIQSTNTVTASVERAVIGADGVLGSWQAASSMNAVRQGFGAVAWNGRLYVMGGCSAANGTRIDTTEYVDINSDGSLGTWQTSAVLPQSRCEFDAAISNGTIYIAGGNTGSGANDLRSYHSTIQSGGNFGSWILDTNLAVTRNASNTIALNGYLYISGGCVIDSCTTDSHSSVERAQINPDGSLSSWSYVTSMNGPRARHELVISNGYLYAIGGCNDPQVTNGCDGTNPNTATIEYTPVLSNGNLGEWQSATSFSAPRQGMGAAVSEGILYITGGRNQTTNLSDTVRFPLQSIARKASYSRLFDLDADVLPTKLFASGSLNGIASKIKFSYKLTPTASTSFGSLVTADPYALDSLITLPASERRYVYVSLTLDDSMSAVFPDSALTPTSITDLMLYYRPAPAKRLRGGKTFTGERERGLDVQP